MCAYMGMFVLLVFARVHALSLLLTITYRHPQASHSVKYNWSDLGTNQFQPTNLGTPCICGYSATYLMCYYLIHALRTPEHRQHVLPHSCLENTRTQAHVLPHACLENTRTQAHLIPHCNGILVHGLAHGQAIMVIIKPDIAVREKKSDEPACARMTRPLT